MNRIPAVVLQSLDRLRDSSSFTFSGFTGEVIARSHDDVVPALRRIEAAVGCGLHAAGFISYEAAPGLDSSFAALPPGPLPLLWFGLFRQREAIIPGQDRQESAGYAADDWRTSLGPEEHAAAVAAIRSYIAAGDAYQVNFTLRRRFRFSGDPFAFYHDLCSSQQAPFCAFVDTDRFKVLSASPELFFRLRDGVLTVRPMKGTVPRGRWWEEDEAEKKRLHEDPKERAENLMIVDLMRNDLGMVAETGSVKVHSLFDIETLPTLHQMTSTITAELRQGAGLVDIFRALFPSGSITGAPKKRAMEIIAELEDSPRGIYTGCIGCISPAPRQPGKGAVVRTHPQGESGTGRRSPANPFEAVFSVAIRTAVIDSGSDRGEMGVGSGITWDSRADAEYRECLAKGRFAQGHLPGFEIVETMLYEHGKGFFLLDRHLERLRRSAAYFGYPYRAESVSAALARRAPSFGKAQKVRLLLDWKGDFTIRHEPLPPATDNDIICVAFAEIRVDSRDPFLYHKTTNRSVYREELARRSDCADVIFCNERGEVTEGANHTIVARLDGALVTPPLACGLLPGVFRQELLDRGEIVERAITRDGLERAEEVWLVNSVRKWRRARLV